MLRGTSVSRRISGPIVPLIRLLYHTVYFSTESGTKVYKAIQGCSGRQDAVFESRAARLHLDASLCGKSLSRPSHSAPLSLFLRSFRPNRRKAAHSSRPSFPHKSEKVISLVQEKGSSIQCAICCCYRCSARRMDEEMSGCLSHG